MKKINNPFGNTLYSWNANLFIFWTRVTDALGVEIVDE